MNQEQPMETESTTSHTTTGADTAQPQPRLADLLDQIEGIITKYVRLPVPVLAMLLAVWIAGVYTFESFRTFGYVALRSATPRCGKTTLLRLIRYLVRDCPPVVTVPTAAILYRATWSVLLLDEIDKLRNADKEKHGELMAVLDAGFEAGGAVPRCKPKSHEVELLPVFYPKALAGIESLADTLADRAFQIQMERSSQRMPRLNMRKVDDVFAQLRNRLQGWATYRNEDIAKAYEKLEDELPCLKGFDDRFQDIAEPLVVLATLADAERPEGPKILSRLLKGLDAAAGRREPSGREKALLAFLEIAEAKVGEGEGTFVRTGDLLADCLANETLSYIESGRKLASFLKHFDLSPKSNGNERGYELSREWVGTWRNRYPKPTT
jgi:hypothetical protein